MKYYGNHKNSKRAGDAGLGKAISWFTCNGYSVSIPLTDSQEYDLIVDKDSTLYRVQVKTSSYRNKAGKYQVNLSVKGGNRSYNTIKKFDKDLVDLIFIVTEEEVLYLIPTKGWDFKPTGNLALGSKYDIFMVD